MSGTSATRNGHLPRQPLIGTLQSGLGGGDVKYASMERHFSKDPANYGAELQGNATLAHLFFAGPPKPCF